MKKGRISADERDFIRAHSQSMTPVAIAERLNRSIDTVNDIIAAIAAVPKTPTTTHKASPADAADRVQIREELRLSEYWMKLKGEFSADELKFFEEGYVKLMSQFRGDVLASEETQICQSIKFELLMGRNLFERKKARDEIERIETLQKALLLRLAGGPTSGQAEDREFALTMESQLNMARQAEQSRTIEYVKLQERHDALMKSLKSTRDQRVEKIFDSKISFLAVIKELSERDVQLRDGRQLELVKLAGQKEYGRLGRPHLYEDGNEDSPILSCDTVNLGPVDETSTSEPEGD